jgi:polyhydroxybutyrate depolymerase
MVGPGNTVVTRRLCHPALTAFWQGVYRARTILWGDSGVRRRLAFALALILLLAGCRGTPRPAPSGPPTGASTRSIEVGGRTRTYRLYRPASLPAAPAPLVVMLHGGFGTAQQAEDSYGWDAEALAGGFLVAYPDGISRAWNVGGDCCGKPGSGGVDDVGFITAMVTDIAARVPVDRARVYATGISNGGLLAYRLACDTTVFAAIGPDSATLLGACPAPAPVSVIHIHGTADHNIPYLGGQGDGFAHIDGPAVPDLVATWRRIDRCAEPAVTVAAPVTTSVAQCPGGRAVELVTIDGAGHQWPGAANKPVRQRVLGLDPPSKALDATDTIWRFFTEHPSGAR